MTDTEQIKIYEITNRLATLSSPVLRLQAILQFSQIVDMLALGDTSVNDNRRFDDIMEENDRLQEELNALKGEHIPESIPPT